MLVFVRNLARLPVMNDSHPPAPLPDSPPNEEATVKQGKCRLDQLLMQRGLVESRTQAQAMIMAGQVQVAGQVVTKAGHPVSTGMAVELKQPPYPWVSRGGLKLVQAIEEFGLDPSGAVAVDIGSSTGGFTDVLLSHGAERVYAVDVGQNQLAWRLRQDPRVLVREGVNARYLTTDVVPEPFDWLVADVSFIGLRVALPAALTMLNPGGQVVALIKPQFELSPKEVAKGGVVRDPALRQKAVDTVVDWFENFTVDGRRFTLQGTVASPILGPAGNQEFLLVGRF